MFAQTEIRAFKTFLRNENLSHSCHVKVADIISGALSGQTILMDWIRKILKYSKSWMLFYFYFTTILSLCTLTTALSMINFVQRFIVVLGECLSCFVRQVWKSSKVLQVNRKSFEVFAYYLPPAWNMRTEARLEERGRTLHLGAHLRTRNVSLLPSFVFLVAVVEHF